MNFRWDNLNWNFSDSGEARKSERTLEVLAPAKVNLFLELRRKLPNGYHELETVMAAVSLFDSLVFRLNESGTTQFSCRSAFPREFQNLSATGFGPVPQGSENLVVRAVDLLLQESSAGQALNSRRGLSISLTKRIPSQAGLGGASADAAAALFGANMILQAGLSYDRLMMLAAQLGSDVSFFLSKSFAVCRGRGEIVDPIAVRPRLDLVIIRPPFGLSTAEVYRHCTIPEVPDSSLDLQHALKLGDPAKISRLLVNRLGEAAGRLTDWLPRLRNWFRLVGALGHQLSGSGSCYFGIFRSAAEARKASIALRNLTGLPTFVVHTL